MERRLLLAVTLMILVAVLPSLFIRKPPPRRSPLSSTDSVPIPPAPAQPAARAAPPSAPRPAPRRAPPAAPPSADTVTLASERARYVFSHLGAGLEAAVFPSFRAFSDTGSVNLVRQGDRLLAHRVVLAGDTIALDSVAYHVKRVGGGVRFAALAGPLNVEWQYALAPGRDYLLEVSGELRGLAGQGALLLIGLGSGLANVEADSMDNYRHYGVVGRRTEPQNQPFGRLRPGETALLDGPFDWVAVKSKYFLGALLSADSTRPSFGGALVTGGPRRGRVATHASTWITMPVGPDGRVLYDVYLGPQEYRALRLLGRRLDKASPYGWVFKPIVMPVATWITRLLIWMHQTLRLPYGWVLVLFGVLVRLLLWPLNQRAMKSSVAMQAIQPLMKDLQTRYKEDPQRLQQEMVKLYREHKVNPFGACLPMLLPFPVLLALFFVFANTIEFRGVAFLWLPDLSQRDPLYIIPLMMGASMWALSKLGQAGLPPNPQAKLMTTVMPLVMTVLFLNFASGLNLYYAVSNIISLPQQYLINQARDAEMARRSAKR